MIFILYFSKLLVAVVILIDDLRRLIFGALNMGFKDHWNLSTARSRWMPYAALILGAIPAITLSYGMALNPYRYRLWKNILSIKDLHPDLSGFRIVQISDIHSGSFLLKEPVETFAKRIRDYWHVENKVHYVRDVTQGEDASRIRVQPLPNMFSLARNLALNLYRDHGFDNMAQAQRKAGHGLNFLKSLFRMK